MTKSTEEKKAAPLPRVQAIKVSEIAPSPLNERGDVVETVDDLVASIKEKGILVPIKVRPVKSGFQVVYGHRRLLAAKKAGLVHVPAIVEEMDDEQADRERLTENLQRLDLHPIDEAKGIARLVKLLGFVDRVAKHLGKDEAYVAERANLVNLDKAGQDWFRSGVITAEHARILARLTPDDQKQALAWLIEYENPEESDYSQEKRSTMVATAKDARLLRTWIDAEIALALKFAPWELDDAELVPKAGACSACPKNSGHNRALFADFQKTDTCGDRACFKGKLEAYRSRTRSEVRKKEKRDFLLLSTHQHLSPEDPLKVEGVKMAGRYKVVSESNACPDTKRAQYVDGPNRGKFTLVCNYSKCARHWAGPAAAKSKAPKTEAREKAEARRRSDERYKGAIEGAAVTLAVTEIARQSSAPAVRLEALRSMVAHEYGGWMSGSQSAMLKEAGISVAETKKAVPAMSEKDLLGAYVAIKADEVYSPALLKAVGVDFKALKEKAAKGVHRCEACGCSEISACRGQYGDGPPCSWRAEERSVGRFVCTRCTAPAADPKAKK